MRREREREGKRRREREGDRENEAGERQPSVRSVKRRQEVESNCSGTQMRDARKVGKIGEKQKRVDESSRTKNNIGMKEMGRESGEEEVSTGIKK
eukprot:scaffold46908_cov27-Tisochrysis_lutea.AAC.1